MVSKMCTSNVQKQQHCKYVWMSGSLMLILKAHPKINPTVPQIALSLYGSEAVAVRFVAVGLVVVEHQHFLFGGPFVSRLLFPHQLSAVVEQVTRQQEASQ